MLSRKKPSRWFYFRWLLTNRRLLVTLALLALYRLLTYVPLPGVDPVILEKATSAPGSPDLVTGLLNLLSGGGFARLSILALGIYPVIAANGFLSFLIPILPGFEERLREDPREGRRILNRWKYILTAPASLLQAFFLFFAVRSSCSFSIIQRFNFQSDPLSAISILATLTAGAYLATWIAEWIDRDGIRGFGLNAIIFSGAALVLSEEIYKIWQGPQAGTLPITWGAFSLQTVHWLEVGIYSIGLLAGLVIMAYFVESKRNIPVIFPGQRLTRPRYKSTQTSTVPIAMRSAWDSIVEAQALLALPLMISSFLACSPQGGLQRAGASVVTALQPDSPWSGPLLFLSVVIFGPVIATLQFNEENLAENLKRNGVQIPGLHMGEETQVYLNNIFLRVSFFAAILAGFIFLIPWIMNVTLGLDTLLLTGEALFLLVVFTHDLFLTMGAEFQLHR